MRLSDILEITRPQCKVEYYTFAYAIEREHAERIRAHTGFALIVFGLHEVHAIRDLGYEPLTRELRDGVSLEAVPVPQFFYPFSINDSHEYIDAHVAPILLSRAQVQPRRSDAYEVFRAIHPFHERYAPAHAAELVEVTRRSIARVLARHGAASRTRKPQDGVA